jgi:hypothetical protein
MRQLNEKAIEFCPEGNCPKVIPIPPEHPQKPRLKRIHLT